MRMPSTAQRNSLASQVEETHRNLHLAQPYLTSRGITEATSERFKLGYDSRTGRLAIPYLTPAGPWHIKYRCLANHNCKDEGHGKYAYEGGQEQHLFNAQTLLEATNVVVVEGELDAISCEQYGIPAVGYPGASTWARSKHWAYCFDSVDEVVVLADGDQPGVKAARDVTEALRLSVNADVKTVSMPDGMDANSFLLAHGEAEFLDLIGWL